jgi:hypothetical protein
MEDGRGVGPVGCAAAGEVWLEKRPIDEDGSQEF